MFIFAPSLHPPYAVVTLIPPTPHLSLPLPGDAYSFKTESKPLLCSEGGSWGDGSGSDWGGLRNTSTASAPCIMIYGLYCHLALHLFMLCLHLASSNFIFCFYDHALQLRPSFFFLNFLFSWRFSSTLTMISFTYNLTQLWCPTNDLCFVISLPKTLLLLWFIIGDTCSLWFSWLRRSPMSLLLLELIVLSIAGC